MNIDRQTAGEAGVTGLAAKKDKISEVTIVIRDGKVVKFEHHLICADEVDEGLLQEGI